MERTKRGQLETTYNDGVVRLPGSYNTGGAFFVNTDELSMYTSLGKQLTEYSFFNLTADARAESLQTHYETMEKILLQQLNRETFDEFFSPNAERQMICGRVCNISTEDQKIKEHSIGLFNGANDAESCRIKLNVNEVPQLMLFEGEVIVAEGFMDSKKFNVNRIIKPKVDDKSKQALLGLQQMQYCQNMYQGKAL